MTASKSNPQPGDLVALVQESPGEEGLLWVVMDFFPWGMDGKHAWTILNTATGKRKVILKSDWKKLEEKA